MISEIVGLKWYVGKNGVDKSICGASLTYPCADLLETINKAEDGDTIMVDAEGTDHQPMIVCTDNYITKSITIKGFNGKPKLACNKAEHDGAILMFTKFSYSFIYTVYYSKKNPSVNSFKFQLCNHTSPGTQRLWFPGSCPPGH